MNKLSPEAQKIRKNGWKQGSFLKIDTPIQAENQKTVINPGIYFILSQDCDIQTPALKDEPHVEIILCVEIEKKDGNYTRGKNPRKIHIPVKKGKKDCYFECEIKQRFFIDREKLIEIQPYNEFSLNSGDIRDVVDWLIKRYRRDAFPDGFNERIDRKALRKIMEDAHERIRHICVQLHTYQELDADKPYEIRLMLLLDKEATDEEREQCITILTKLVEKLEQKNKSDVKLFEVIDENISTIEEISYSDFLDFRQLDFDYLSVYEN